MRETIEPDTSKKAAFDDAYQAFRAAYTGLKAIQ